MCPVGYHGPTCALETNECAQSPCRNGATCVDLVGSYRCQCVAGYSGRNCEVDINECAGSPCQNEGKSDFIIDEYILGLAITHEYLGTRPVMSWSGYKFT